MKRIGRLNDQSHVVLEFLQGMDYIIILGLTKISGALAGN